MPNPFEKKPAPISYAEEPRLMRAIQHLVFKERERFWNAYRRHIEKPIFVTVQRRGHLIFLVRADSNVADVYDFGKDFHAQQVLAALTDCFRANRTPVKVLMPVSPDSPN